MHFWQGAIFDRELVSGSYKRLFFLRSCQLLFRRNFIFPVSFWKSSFVQNFQFCHYPSLPFITLHYPSLPCITLHYPTLPFITLHYPALPFITLHYPALPCITLHYPSLPYITLNYPALPCITLQVTSFAVC